MIIERDAVAGSLESGDALVRVSPYHELEVNVTTSVETQYGDAVRAVIAQTLAELGVSGAVVTVVDKGALDFALRARVQTAVARSTDAPLSLATLVGGAS